MSNHHSYSPYNTFEETGRINQYHVSSSQRQRRRRRRHYKRLIIVIASLVYAFAGFNSALADNLLGPSLEACSIQIGCKEDITNLRRIDNTHVHYPLRSLWKKVISPFSRSSFSSRKPIGDSSSSSSSHLLRRKKKRLGDEESAHGDYFSSSSSLLQHDTTARVTSNHDGSSTTTTTTTTTTHNSICPEMSIALTMDRVGAFVSILIDVSLASATSQRWLGVRLDSHHALFLAMISIPIGELFIATATVATQMQLGFFLVGLGNGLGLMEATALLLPVYICVCVCVCVCVIIKVHENDPEAVAYWVSVVHALSGLGAFLGPQLISFSQPNLNNARMLSGIMCLLVALMCIILPFYIDATATRPLGNSVLVFTTTEEEEEEEEEEEGGGGGGRRGGAIKEQQEEQKDMLLTRCGTDHLKQHHRALRKQKYDKTATSTNTTVSFKLESCSSPPSYLSSSTTKTAWGEFITATIYLYLAVVLGLEFVLPSYISPFCEISGVGSNYVGNLITSGFWSAFVMMRFVVVIAESIFPIDHAMLLTIFNGVALSCSLSWTMYPKSSWSLWLGSLGIGAMLAPSFPSAIVVLTETRTVLKHKYVILAFFFAYAGMVGCNFFFHLLLSGNRDVGSLPWGVSALLFISFILVMLATAIFHLARPKSNRRKEN